MNETPGGAPMTLRISQPPPSTNSTAATLPQVFVVVVVEANTKVVCSDACTLFTRTTSSGTRVISCKSVRDMKFISSGDWQEITSRINDCCSA